VKFVAEFSHSLGRKVSIVIDGSRPRACENAESALRWKQMARLSAVEGCRGRVQSAKRMIEPLIDSWEIVCRLAVEARLSRALGRE
jgi:hypothetical protein